MGSYYTLLNALAEDGRLDEAEELWTKLFSENLESMPRLFFEKMISIYYRREMHEKMFEVPLLISRLLFLLGAICSSVKSTLSLPPPSISCPPLSCRDRRNISAFLHLPNSHSAYESL